MINARLPASNVQIYDIKCFNALLNRRVLRRDFQTETVVEVTTI